MEVQIRENITPIGDGNGKDRINTKTRINKREYNSDRRRKPLYFLKSFKLAFFNI